jgi:hypothetical protein
LADRAVLGSNIQKRKGHQNVQGWIRLLLGATFNRGKDTKMSIGRKGCCWEQHSIEERTPKCPLADWDVYGSNVQKRGGHISVHGQKKLPLQATFNRRT